jgi:hypothetical protein
MRRKGQITVFIIIGLIIVISIFLYLYLKQRANYFQPEVVTPTEIMPIQQYVQSCIYDSAKDAINTLGMQSGFIEIPADIRRNPSSYLRVDPFGMLIRPFWYYRGQVRIPSEDYLKYEISQYVQDNLINCVGDFRAFAKQFDIVAGQARVTTSMGDKSVIVEVDFPIEIRDRKVRKITNIRKFKSEVPVRLKAAYQLAKKIMEAENNERFLENVTIDLMAASPKIPFTGMEFQCGALKWQVSSVKSVLQDLLNYNLLRIKIDNTNYAPFEASPSEYKEFSRFTMEDINDGKLPSTSPPSDAYEYFHFLFDVGNNDRTLKAKIIYRPDYGMDLVAMPSRDGVMRSDLVEGQAKFLSYICINIYHFVYDITYPVEVVVRDDSSFGGLGYLFTFAFPVVIFHNQGDRSVRGTMLFDIRVPAEGFCENLGQEEYTVTAFGTYEGYTDSEIPDVDIQYECMSQHCKIGQTKADNGYYRLRTLLPEGCVNPFLIANKTGYLATREQVLGNEVSIRMKKLKPVSFKVVKHVYQEFGGTIGSAEELGEGEMAAISLTLANSSYSQYAQYPLQGNMSREISLVEDSAEYKLDVAFLKDNEYVGGYIDDNFKISLNDIVQAEEIEIPVIEYRPTPVTDPQKAATASYVAGGSYKSAIRPVLK